ncbi:outer membrane beta-barrel protein [Paraflavisolibacter sp. H34]|uniref:outer membrane beta-barrel protein n=1 Tax=Huijunlia imazamoxiresistens TaxID=3127457 RepID=UPI003019E7F1
MLRKITFSAIALTSLYAAKAQDSAAVESVEKKAFAISGYVDAYYRYNFNNPKKELDATNNYTSFTNSQNSFELGMASVKLEHSIGKVGVVADLGFGKRAEEFSYADDKTRMAVKQAYITYAPTANLKLTAGNFATHVGYELVDPYLNRNYSMSYMFSYGPFSHTGLKADYSFGKSAVMLGVVNPTDFKSANFARKFLIGQYSLSTEKVKMFLNYQGGTFADYYSAGTDNFDGKVQQGDLVLTATLSDKFSLGYNGTLQSVKLRDKATAKSGDNENWWGSALYVNADPTPAFGLTLRGEYFDNAKMANPFAPATSLFATTLSVNLKAGPLTFVPELRMENAKDAIFVKHAGEATKSAATGLLAAIYKF